MCHLPGVRSKGRSCDHRELPRRQEGPSLPPPPLPPGRNSDALQYLGAAHAPAPAETPQVDRAAVKRLCAMGFLEKAVIAALLANSGASEAALNALLSG